jgi:signal-transduction protein with cAMP-binding, CBS, and nucleotidyltransferase domain
LYGIYPQGKERTSRRYAVIGKLYAKLAPEVYAFLLQHSFAATVPKGTVLMKHGVPPEYVIILKAGKVQISTPYSCCAVALDGEDCERVFGLYAALSGEKPELDIICTDDCDVTLMRKDIFETVVQRNPPMDFTVAIMLGNETTTAHQILTIARRRSTSRA